MAKEIWDLRYAAEDYYYGKSPNAFFQEKIAGLKPGKLLLPAEGEGRNAVYAASLGWDVTAVDFSEAGQRKAMQLAKDHQVMIRYHVSDVIDYDFGTDHYDVAALIYLHLPPETRKQVHQRISKSLKPGGVLILEAFNKQQLRNASGGPQSLEMLYSMDSLKGDFDGLEIIRVEELTVHIEAGNGHGGDADLVRLYAVKKSIR